ncbi:hypothetical protein [Thermocoleostomius sinensis]|uniref:Uncharacterized protein n=1 Tax=Thermocoleostomius sinensis A174 TaxID=2016057 RepID=A0A9E8ZCU0_9CYAN|nr:hypothetical protein [Thermocoleostomius sinensis]WAL60895.1 hypothetical protein OXH18_02540 [Thermocoleostomius sinensis A174]
MIRLWPNCQRVILDRFRSRSDAEGHARAMWWLVPDAEFVVVFEPVGSASNEGDRTFLRQPFPLPLPNPLFLKK